MGSSSKRTILVSEVSNSSILSSNSSNGSGTSRASSSVSIRLRENTEEDWRKAGGQLRRRSPRRLGNTLRGRIPSTSSSHRASILVLLGYSSMAVVIWVILTFGVIGPTTWTGMFGVLFWFTSFFSLLFTVWFKWAESR